MQYRQLGSTGLRVSELALGTWRFGKETNGVVETTRDDAMTLLDSAWDMGINFIDTANVYGTPTGRSEEFIGGWLSDHDREEVVLASKVYFPTDETNPNGRGLSRKHILDQVEKSLERLGTDYLDIYYLHRWDEHTPIEETLQALDYLVSEGKVQYLGASTMTAWQLMKAQLTAEKMGVTTFDVAQPLHHAGYYEDVKEYLNVCTDQEMAVCNYSPLAGGFLTGKYERADPDDPEKIVGPDGARGSFDGMFGDWYASERGWKVLEEVRSVADELDATPAQVALRWVMDWDEFTAIPIIGARTPDQLQENVDATKISMSDDQWDRIMDARYRPDGSRWGH